MKINIVLLSLSIFLFAACKEDPMDDEWITLRSPITSATVTSHSISHVEFIAKAGWPQGGGGFSHADIVRNGSTFFITVYGMQEKGATSSTSPIEFDAPVVVQIPSAGTYTFRFWQMDTLSYDTTLTVQ